MESPADLGLKEGNVSQSLSCGGAALYKLFLQSSRRDVQSLSGHEANGHWPPTGDRHCGSEKLLDGQGPEHACLRPVHQTYLAKIGTSGPASASLVCN